ncbi:putative Early nodulin 55-2 precursor [Hibiscus syriacus]|uniref:Early nodulin 55-2 n=1 Tax=Hibiscus syriacus TaxID=106335 RepID=A0A6A2WYU6_HIBSY|nr:putative Early nodulin 55-2 precursor [Hibiscus syriacus]
MPGKTLSARKWQAAFSLDGHLDIGKTLRRTQRGGIHPSIRGEVWEFLLGCYDPESTFDDRDQIRQHRRMQYARWKNECREIFPVMGSGKYITAPVITDDCQPIQDPLVLLETNPGNYSGRDANKADMVNKLLLRGLDVIRTDRTLVFYEKQENLSKLWDILSFYAWIDTDVGHGQGDAINIVSDEYPNTVVKLIYCNLHSFYLDLYCFLNSLQMMWALEYDPDLFSLYEEPGSKIAKAVGSSKGKPKSTRQCGKYERENMKTKSSDAPLPISVFLVASVLKDKSSKLLHESRGLDDVVKILNDMTGNLDAKKACIGALKLHKKYLKQAKKT